MFDMPSILLVIAGLIAGAAIMWGVQHLVPNAKILRAKQAKRALKALAKEMGSDDSEEAQRQRDELARELRFIAETANKLPEVK